MLKWAREHSCPWDERTCENATMRGRTRVLKWARNHGAPWSWRTCALALDAGHLEALEWAVRHGAPMDRVARRFALKRGWIARLPQLSSGLAGTTGSRAPLRPRASGRDVRGTPIARTRPRAR